MLTVFIDEALKESGIRAAGWKLWLSEKAPDPIPAFGLVFLSRKELRMQHRYH